MWWDILKDAKLSGKATGKGSSIDISRLNFEEKDDCKKELKKILSNARFNSNPSEIYFTYINELPEEVACKFVKTLKYKLPPNYSSNDKIFYGRCEINVAENIQADGDNYKMVIINEKADNYKGMYVALRAPYGVQFASFVFTAEDYAKWVKSL